MKLILHIFIVLFTMSSSCEDTKINQNIILIYKAQTRGFLYELSLKNNTLEINNNSSIKKTNLNKGQLTLIEKSISQINFDEIKNNLSREELAVDKAIEGKFELKFNNKTHLFNFNHNNLPIEIKELFIQLESYFK